MAIQPKIYLLDGETTNSNYDKFYPDLNWFAD